MSVSAVENAGVYGRSLNSFFGFGENDLEDPLVK